ncbi:MAG: hypothetical protein ACRD1Y_11995 [Terriglobales bacterium]
MFALEVCLGSFVARWEDAAPRLLHVRTPAVLGLGVEREPRRLLHDVGVELDRIEGQCRREARFSSAWLRCWRLKTGTAQVELQSDKGDQRRWRVPLARMQRPLPRRRRGRAALPARPGGPYRASDRCVCLIGHTPRLIEMTRSAANAAAAGLMHCRERTQALSWLGVHPEAALVVI